MSERINNRKVTPTARAAAALARMPEELVDEIMLRHDTESEYNKSEGDPVEPFDLAFMESAIGWVEDSFAQAGDERLPRGWQKAIREFYITTGVARHVTDDELARVTVSSGSKFWFKLDGKKYIFATHLVRAEGIEL